VQLYNAKIEIVNSNHGFVIL